MGQDQDINLFEIEILEVNVVLMKSRYKASICNLYLVNYFDDHEFYDECESV